MNTLSLIGGALALRTDTFKTLRERSDVFYKGFLIVVLVGLLAGAFAAGADLAAQVINPPSETLITQEALRGFSGSYYGPPELKPVIESYITEGVGMAVELSALPPNSGAAFRPFVQLLNWVGLSASMPFSGSFMGFLLFAGLLVHLSCRWLGGRAGMAQMLGLSALGLAPHVLDPVGSLLRLAGSLSGAGVFASLASLLGLVVLVWGAVIYVKATAIAQGFSYSRALGGLLIALGLTALLVVLTAFVLGGLVGGLIAVLVSALG